MTNQGHDLYKKARKYIPGGTQLLSKRPEMFLPEQWPSYYSKAKGVEVWGVDGHKYIDMSISGVGSTVLGYADSDVDAAVKEVIEAGSMCTLNVPEEIELAELLCDIHPWADKVRYARSGGEIMAMAVRIARAHTQRDKVAFCGYHGWHDWYLAANLSKDDILDGHLLPGLEPAGVPTGLRGTALPFHYNQLEELKTIVTKHGSELAAIVMEPIRNDEPTTGFLEGVRQIASETGAILIFDEITAGWRLNSGGIHLLYQVNPDMAVFAKAMSNGYPMAAIIGTATVMESAQSSFISSTYWTERIGPTAALATIRKHQQNNVGQHLKKIGQMVLDGWTTLAKRTGISITTSGIPPLAHFSFSGYDNGQAMQTLFNQLMLEQGYLAKNVFYAMNAHQSNHIEAYLDVVESIFLTMKQAVDNNNVEAMLKGPLVHTGFQRLN